MFPIVELDAVLSEMLEFRTRLKLTVLFVIFTTKTSEAIMLELKILASPIWLNVALLKLKVELNIVELKIVALDTMLWRIVALIIELL